MSVKITWLGHSGFSLVAGVHRLVIDPFLHKNDNAPSKDAAVDCDYVFVTYGHFDHIDDAAPIAKRTGAKVLANFEVARWLSKQGVAGDKIVALNPGGGMAQPFGRAKLTIAHHSSSM